MDDHANPRPDENDGRPAIPANADLYPHFARSISVDVQRALETMRPWFAVDLHRIEPADQAPIFATVQQDFANLLHMLSLYDEAVRAEEDLYWSNRSRVEPVVDPGPHAQNLAEAIEARIAAENERRDAVRARTQADDPDLAPAVFSASLPPGGPAIAIDPQHAARVFDILRQLVRMLVSPDRMEIAVSWDDTSWRLNVFYQGGSYEALQRVWGLYVQRDSLLIFGQLIEGMGLALCRKRARQYGGDLDLQFGSGPARPGFKPLINRITVALRLPRADRAA